jgi:hypothetical protein
VKYILFAISFLLVLGFQNCSKVGFNPDTSSSAFKSGRDAGDDGLLGGGVEPGDDGSMGDGEIPGDDGSVGGRDDDGDDSDVSDIEDDKDWLYIPGGRGHVPMSSVAICPADSKDAGNQKCPMFCFEGKDYVMHKSLARRWRCGSRNLCSSEFITQTIIVPKSIPKYLHQTRRGYSSGFFILQSYNETCRSSVATLRVHHSSSCELQSLDPYQALALQCFTLVSTRSRSKYESLKLEQTANDFVDRRLGVVL